jgi:Dolichyl-phosphate-mannose-protein mannosyltransferase
VCRLHAQGSVQDRAGGPKPYLVWFVALCVASYDIFLLTGGLGNSLWQDEAFVANSVVAKTVAGIFYPADWLQSTPPLLLILARAVVLIFGITNVTLRVIPVCMGLLAIGTTLFFGARLLWRNYALLAWVMLILSPVEITFSKLLKQYSAEFFVTTAILVACSLYIEKTSARRFWLLVATTGCGLLIGYGIALLVPGVALLIWMYPVRPSRSSRAKNGSASFRRAVIFAAIAGALTLGEYRIFAIPNGTQVQHIAFAKKNASFPNWATMAASESYDFIGEIPLNHRFQQPGIRIASVVVVLALGLALSLQRFRKGKRKWLAIQAVCLVPILILIVSDRFVLYPFTERTALFALPCLVTSLVCSFQLVSLLLMKGRRDWIRPILDVAVLAGIALTLIASRAKSHRVMWPQEDVSNAVTFLKANVQPGDLLWVHSTLSQTVKLYLTMYRWDDAPVHFGNTAWPCCSRGILDTQYTSSEPLVRADFGKAVEHFSGRVWLTYTTRPEHWVGFAYEPQIMRDILYEKGCKVAPEPPPTFIHVAVLAFDCPAPSAGPLQLAMSQQQLGFPDLRARFARSLRRTGFRKNKPPQLPPVSLLHHPPANSEASPLALPENASAQAPVN